MKKIAVFPGSFDPFTKGHEDIVRRGIMLFDEIIIAIGVNGTKTRYFTAELMQSKIANTFQDLPNVKVAIFSGLTAKFASDNGANFLLRGVRNTTDFEYENTIAQVNKHLIPDLETFFLITSPLYASISSSIVRDLHKHGASVDTFLPYSLDLPNDFTNEKDCLKAASLLFDAADNWDDWGKMISEMLPHIASDGIKLSELSNILMQQWFTKEERDEAIEKLAEIIKHN